MEPLIRETAVRPGFSRGTVYATFKEMPPLSGVFFLGRRPAFQRFLPAVASRGLSPLALTIPRIPSLLRTSLDQGLDTL